MGLCLPTITEMTFLLGGKKKKKTEGSKINTALMEGFDFSGTYHCTYGYFLYIPQEFCKTVTQLLDRTKL